MRSMTGLLRGCHSTLPLQTCTVQTDRQTQGRTDGQTDTVHHTDRHRYGLQNITV